MAILWKILERLSYDSLINLKWPVGPFIGDFLTQSMNNSDVFVAIFKNSEKY